MKVAPHIAVPILQGRKWACKYAHKIEADATISGRTFAIPLILGSHISVTKGWTNVFTRPYKNPKQTLGINRNKTDVAKERQPQHIITKGIRIIRSLFGPINSPIVPPARFPGIAVKYMLETGNKNDR